MEPSQANKFPIRKIFILIFILISCITLPLLLYAAKQNQDNRSSAAAADKLESEGGILAGNARVQSDSNASGGKYIRFIEKDKYDAIRLAWEEYITGGDYDKSDSELKALVDARAANIVAKARNNKNALITTPGRTSLFSDIPTAMEGRGIDDTYTRIQTMAEAYAIPGAITDPAEKEELYKSIKNSLRWLNNNWYNVDTCKGNNWAQQPCPQSLVFQVGIPTSLTTSIILIYDRLSQDNDAEEFIAKNMNAVERFYPNPRSNNSNSYYPRTEHDTAGNLAMATIPLILRAGISTDENKRKIALDEAIFNYNEKFLPYTTQGDGLYRDGSFIQHQNHPYNMWYGSFFLNKVVDLSLLLNNSGITNSNPNKLYEWFKAGYQPLTFNTDSMDMVKGRIATYPRTTPNLPSIALLDPEIKILSMLSGEKYNDLGNDIINKTGRKIVKTDIFSIIQTHKLVKNINLSGQYLYNVAKVFPRMDKAVVVKPDYAFGISMSSSRIYTFESIQNQNKKGWYVSDGMLYFYNKSDPGQYNDWFWATVDKTRLPGTTIDRQIQLDSNNNYIGENYDGELSNYLSPKDYAGGAQLNNTFLTVGMSLKSKLNVQAKKSYFIFDNEIVALGSDIISTSGKTVETIIENRKIKDDNSNEFVVNGSPISDSINIADPKWAYLEGTGGYYLPSGGQIISKKETRKGSWKQLKSDEGGTMSPPKNFAEMRFNHGVNPTSGKYAYVFLPNASKAQTISYSTNPDVQILTHSSRVHAVKDNSGVTQVNFFSSGAAGYLTAENQSTIISKEASDSLELAASDPTQNQNLLTFTLNKTAKSVVSKDSKVTILSLNPIKFTINVEGARGQTFNVKLSL